MSQPQSLELLSPLERRIHERAKAFDLGPLLRLLEAQGYDAEHTLFESNPEPVATASLVEAVTFHASPVRRVVVMLNLGLQGANGLLPSYFQQVAEQLPDPEPFNDFLRFFDHRLLQGLVRALHPERDTGLVGDWEETKDSYFRMVGVSSVATLQWLFQQYFPELRLVCARQRFRTRSEGHGPRAGPTPLDGTGVLGNAYAVELSGFQVELQADEELDPRGTPWPVLVQQRFHRFVLPLLKPARLRLEVVLTVPHGLPARLGPPGSLGYERFPAKHDGPLRRLIFLGDTADAVRPPPLADTQRRGLTMGAPARALP